MNEKVPLVVKALSMGADVEGPSATFALETEAGEVFEVAFSVAALLQLVIMARNWTLLRNELDALPPPGPPR